MEPTDSGASWWDDYEDWELCNDDGFVFRRPKRRRVDPDAEAPASSSAATLPEDPEKLRRERKKNSLLRLKSRYQAEIDQWGILSSTMRAMEERAREQRQQQEQQRREEQERESTASLGGCDSSELRGSGSACGLVVVDELLSQAETHEAIIRDVSNLCDIAEAMCDAEDEHIAESLFDLPIWASPQELMAALCDA